MMFLHHTVAFLQLAISLNILRECVAWSPVNTVTATPRRLKTSLSISNIIGGGGAANGEPSLPKDVKEAVSQCRTATQEALKNRMSRMDIEFPVGTNFQVEKTPKNKKRKSNQPPTTDDLTRSDRELARLFVDMFQPVGGENIAVCFTDMDEADVAKKKWKGDATARCNILSMDRSKASKKKKKASSKKKGFAAKLAQEMDDDSGSSNPSGPFQIPQNTEVAIFVSPSPKELIVVEKICNEVGMGTLVILLNARMSLHTTLELGTPASETLFRNEFETVFHLAAAPQQSAPNCLLYRSYPGKWVMARKPKVGQPIPVSSTKERPTAEQCAEAFEKLEIGPMERNVENVLDNVAGWFA